MENRYSVICASGRWAGKNQRTFSSDQLTDAIRILFSQPLNFLLTEVGGEKPFLELYDNERKATIAQFVKQEGTVNRCSMLCPNGVAEIVYALGLQDHSKLWKLSGQQLDVAEFKVDEHRWVLSNNYLELAGPCMSPLLIENLYLGQSPHYLQMLGRERAGWQHPDSTSKKAHILFEEKTLHSDSKALVAALLSSGVVPYSDMLRKSPTPDQFYPVTTALFSPGQSGPLASIGNVLGEDCVLTSRDLERFADRFGIDLTAFADYKPKIGTVSLVQLDTNDRVQYASGLRNFWIQHASFAEGMVPETLSSYRVKQTTFTGDAKVRRLVQLHHLDHWQQALGLLVTAPRQMLCQPDRNHKPSAVVMNPQGEFIAHVQRGNLELDGSQVKSAHYYLELPSDWEKALEDMLGMHLPKGPINIGRKTPTGYITTEAGLQLEQYLVSTLTQLTDDRKKLRQPHLEQLASADGPYIVQVYAVPWNYVPLKGDPLTINAIYAAKDLTTAQAMMMSVDANMLDPAASMNNGKSGFLQAVNIFRKFETSPLVMRIGREEPLTAQTVILLAEKQLRPDELSSIMTGHKALASSSDTLTRFETLKDHHQLYCMPQQQRTVNKSPGQRPQSGLRP